LQQPVELCSKQTKACRRTLEEESACSHDDWTKPKKHGSAAILRPRAAHTFRQNPQKSGIQPERVNISKALSMAASMAPSQHSLQPLASRAQRSPRRRADCWPRKPSGRRTFDVHRRLSVLQSESEYEAAEREREAWEVENYPEGEKLELEEIYRARGMAEADAKAVVDIISKDKKAWVDTMMVEELGIMQSDESPVANAIATFISFAAFGFLPISAYVVALFVPSLDAIRFPLHAF